MPTREPTRKAYVWKPFNVVYGPWYRLMQANGKVISGGEAVVQPDMDRSRWFWFVRIGKREAPRKVVSGHQPTLEEAKDAARDAFDLHY